MTEEQIVDGLLFEKRIVHGGRHELDPMQMYKLGALYITCSNYHECHLLIEGEGMSNLFGKGEGSVAHYICQAYQLIYQMHQQIYHVT